MSDTFCHCQRKLFFQVADLRKQLARTLRGEEKARNRLAATKVLLNERTAELGNSSSKCMELEARNADLLVKEQDGAALMAVVQASIFQPD